MGRPTYLEALRRERWRLLLLLLLLELDELEVVLGDDEAGSHGADPVRFQLSHRILERLTSVFLVLGDVSPSSRAGLEPHVGLPHGRAILTELYAREIPAWFRRRLLRRRGQVACSTTRTRGAGGHPAPARHRPRAVSPCCRASPPARPGPARAALVSRGEAHSQSHPVPRGGAAPLRGRRAPGRARGDSPRSVRFASRASRPARVPSPRDRFPRQWPTRGRPAPSRVPRGALPTRRGPGRGRFPPRRDSAPTRGG